MDFRPGNSTGIFVFLLATLLHLVTVPALNITDSTARQSIQKTYDLTKYLEHQLQSLAGPYLNYLGPPFNEPDFNPPRVSATEKIPSAMMDIQLWRNLNDHLRLAENYRAYSHLLCYLRGIDGEVAWAELRHNLDHFCSSLQGLIISIAGVMSSLGYPLPPQLGNPTRTRAGVPNDFLKKMDDFWLLKELQTWLWRSARDFNQLKKKIPPFVAIRLDAHGF
ncbi:cardiotrophin-like cytokine factor 1 [Microcaecilia unicolor]|uniref:Cardiotrophin-like cytokine factor 1 n=1 Tax=Microcaecilia unicolor TaxID=1415580 RepID=A0A6P7X7K7_9AMPH|nr:cardiotrophin-like cytokine factor 1 [Microcaecilia unicolor]